MNQSVQILDGFSYNKENLAMEIKAFDCGQLVPCFIGDIDEKSADMFYQHHQFDIEESLVDLIEDEQWNENGEVWLSAVDIAI